MGLGLLIPNAQSLIADYYSALSRGKAFGALYLMGALGGMLGALVSECMTPCVSVGQGGRERGGKHTCLRALRRVYRSPHPCTLHPCTLHPCTPAHCSMQQILATHTCWDWRAGGLPSSQWRQFLWWVTAVEVHCVLNLYSMQHRALNLTLKHDVHLSCCHIACCVWCVLPHL